MAPIIKPILAEVSRVALAHQLIDLIGKCAECETVKGIIGIAGVASAAPLLVPAAALVGMELFKAKGERKQEEEFQEHCNEVIEFLAGLDGRVDIVADQLNDLIQHRKWVWARFSGVDQAAFAKGVRGEIKKDLTALGIDIRDDLEGLRIYSETILVKVDQVITNQSDQSATLLSLREEMRLIREVLSNKPSPSADNQPPAVPEPVAKAARTVQQNPEASLLERAEAAIVSRSPQALDQLAQLDALVETADYKRHQLRGDYHYFRGEFDKAIKPFEQAMALRPRDITARNNAACTQSFARLGDIAAHQRRAMAIHEGTLKLVAPNSPDCSTTLHYLGVAWQKLPTGERAKNLQNAIDCYTRALEVYTQADFPAGWATTQNNLGNAWGDLPTGERAKNLQNAIDCFTRALEVRTRADFPAGWATTQNNLGIALAAMADQQILPAGKDRCGLLRRAIACSKGALTVRTSDAFPREYADTLKNMNIDRRAYEAGGCAEKVPFDDILPAFWAGAR